MQNDITNLLWDFLVENSLATKDEISLVCNINGTSEETYNDIIWCRTEYHNVPQIYACKPDNYVFDDDLLDYYDLLQDDEDETEDEEETDNSEDDE